ncbi:MAG: hypothetical protein OSW77_06480 [Proteobacteria bacterium]|nr:hypothetical protein [Pseudomonadota bacterium]
MSVRGNALSIVSLGMSCQTAYQIKRQAALLTHLTGAADLRPLTLPFDWVIRSPGDTVGAIEALSFYPESVREMTLNDGIPYWARRRTFYWHDFDSPDFAPHFDEVAGKYRHLTDNFVGLGTCRRNVFVISNVQNNLELHATRTGCIDIFLDADTLRATPQAIARRFPASRNEFLVVSYRDRIAPGIDLPDTRIALFPRDPSEWEGADALWASIFRTVLGG